MAELSLRDHHDALMEGGTEALSWLDDELWARFPFQLRGVPKAISQFGVDYATYGNGAVLPEGETFPHTNLGWQQLAGMTLSCLETVAKSFKEPVAIVWRRPLEVRVRYQPAGKYNDFEIGAIKMLAEPLRQRFLSCRLHLVRYETVQNQIKQLLVKSILAQKSQPREL